MSKPDNMEERLEAVRLYGEYSQLFDDWNGSGDGRNKMQGAYDVYLEFASANNVLLATDDDGHPMKCAASDVPLIEADQWLDDLETNEYFLRSALGLPPRAQEEEEKLPDMAEATA